MDVKYTHEFLKGKKFNALSYVKFSHRNKKSVPLCYWKCDCGKEILYSASDVVSGRKKSCNCFKFRKNKTTINGKDMEK